MKKQILIGLTLIFGTIIAQTNTHQFSKLDSLLKQEIRPSLIFVHTDWCKICHQMESTTLQNDSVKLALEAKFHFVSLNAEDTSSIEFQGHKFDFIPNGNNSGTHQLAIELASINGKINYPTIVILNKKLEIIFQYAGLLYAKELLAVLQKAIE